MKGLMKMLTTTVLCIAAMAVFAQGPGDDTREEVQFDPANMDPQTIVVRHPDAGMTKSPSVQMTFSLEPQKTKVKVNDQGTKVPTVTFSQGKNNDPVTGKVIVTDPKK